jgi:hypothetical protein
MRVAFSDEAECYPESVARRTTPGAFAWLAIGPSIVYNFRSVANGRIWQNLMSGGRCVLQKMLGFVTLLDRNVTAHWMGNSPVFVSGWRSARAMRRLCDDGQVAQSVEQRIENPCVGGSIPPLATNFTVFCRGSFAPRGPSMETAAQRQTVAIPEAASNFANYC